MKTNFIQFFISFMIGVFYFIQTISSVVGFSDFDTNRINQLKAMRNTFLRERQIQSARLQVYQSLPKLTSSELSVMRSIERQIKSYDTQLLSIYSELRLLEK